MEREKKKKKIVFSVKLWRFNSGFISKCIWLRILGVFRYIYNWRDFFVIFLDMLYFFLFISFSYIYFFYFLVLWGIIFCFVYRLIIFLKGIVSEWNKYIVIFVLNSRNFFVWFFKREMNKNIYFNDIILYNICF